MKISNLSLFVKGPLFLIFSILSLQSCVEPKQEVSPNRPNIVLILSDDQNFETINALGNEEIHTPNLDRLVEMGTTFSHAYNMGSWTGAVCVPSRTMLVTGRSVWNARKLIPQLDNDSTTIAQTWPMLMKKAGYQTYMTGKWHVRAKTDVIFDEVIHERPGMPNDAWIGNDLSSKFKAVEAGVLTWDQIMPPGYNRPKSREDQTWSPFDTTRGGFWKGGTHWSEVLRDDAIHFIEQAKSRDDPFFMYLAFNAPHDPRQAPKEFVDLYTPEALTLPENFLPEHPFKDAMGCSRKLRDEALAPFPRTSYSIQKNKQEYYAIISHMDSQIEKILDALEASGKMKNTYIFFTSDHGLAMGQHGLMGKQNLYDHSIRVPLVVVGKDIPKNHRVNHDVYLQDVMPSSLELAGIKKPEHVAFHSLLDLAKIEDAQSHYPAIYGAYTQKQRMIRKEGFKLIVFPEIKEVLLFDMEKDPLEMTDLSKIPTYESKVYELFEALILLQQELNDDLDLDPVFQAIKRPVQE